MVEQRPFGLHVRLAPAGACIGFVIARFAAGAGSGEPTLRLQCSCPLQQLHPRVERWLPQDLIKQILEDAPHFRPLLDACRQEIVSVYGQIAHSERDPRCTDVLHRNSQPGPISFSDPHGDQIIDGLAH